MTERRGDEAMWAALAIGGAVLTMGGLAVAVASSGRVARSPQPEPDEDPEGIPKARRPSTRAVISDDDVEAAARMIASENEGGSRELWTEQIGTQLHARKPGQSLFDRITAGSGYGPQGGKEGAGQVRPVSTDKLALAEHRQHAAEVLLGLHLPRFPGAIAFFEPAQQDKAFTIAQRARAKQKLHQPLTDQERRLLRYTRSAAEVRAEWGKSLRASGTIDGVEFYEMSRLTPEKADFAVRMKAKQLAWPIARTEIVRIGDPVTESRPGTGNPHKGVDIFAPTGTSIHAARSGRVKRIIDGRKSDRETARRAGLWVDVQVGDQIDRYLHLGEALVREGQAVRRGDVIGLVAEAGTSGTGDAPHLHFEVRASDYSSERKDYGDPIQPKFEVV